MLEGKVLDFSHSIVLKFSFFPVMKRVCCLAASYASFTLKKCDANVPVNKPVQAEAAK